VGEDGRLHRLPPERLDRVAPKLRDLYAVHDASLGRRTTAFRMDLKQHRTVRVAKRATVQPTRSQPNIMRVAFCRTDRDCLVSNRCPYAP
jgi:hypothetical protein